MMVRNVKIAVTASKVLQDRRYVKAECLGLTHAPGSDVSKELICLVTVYFLMFYK